MRKDLLGEKQQEQYKLGFREHRKAMLSDARENVKNDKNDSFPI